MKKLLLSLITGFMLCTTSIAADEFDQSSSFHSYQGGYITLTRRHWTSYSVNSRIKVYSTIQVRNYVREKNVGTQYSKIVSNSDVGPYEYHVHGGGAV